MNQTVTRHAIGTLRKEFLDLHRTLKHKDHRKEILTHIQYSCCYCRLGALTGFLPGKITVLVNYECELCYEIKTFNLQSKIVK